MANEASVKGYVAHSAGNYTNAIRHYTEAINHEPNNTTLYGNRSYAYYQLQQFSNALEDAKKAVNLKPNEYMGYRRLGAAYSGLKQYDDAVSAYKKGLEVDPNNVGLQSALASVQAIIKARAALDAARSSRPLNDEKEADPTTTHAFNVNQADSFSVKTALSVLNRMVDDGLILKCGQLWCVATDLFEDAGKRELFVSMPDDDGRIAWLKHNYKKN